MDEQKKQLVEMLVNELKSWGERDDNSNMSAISLVQTVKEFLEDLKEIEEEEEEYND